MPMFLDFEASGLYNGSYPIEAGMAWDEAGESRSEGFLIIPDKGWQSWSRESEVIHGLSRAQLTAEGISVEQAAMRVLRRIEAADTVHSDAPDYEKVWLDTLLTAGRVERNRCRAAIAKIEHAVEAWGMACRPLLALLPPNGDVNRGRIEDWVRSSARSIVERANSEEERRVRVRHRAVPDAEGMLWTWREARRKSEAASLAWQGISPSELANAPF